MSRFEKRLILGLVLAILLIAGLEASVPKPTDWSASYSLDSRKPYGTALVHDRLKDLFPEVRTVRQPVLDAATRRIEEVVISEAPVNHVYIDGRFGLDRASMEQLLVLVEYGDRVFIAAEDFYDNLADTLNISTSRLHWSEDDTSDIRFIGDHRITEGAFHFSRSFPGAYFTSYDTTRTRVLAVDGASNPVLLEIAWGEGRIVLCAAPRAFCNYNLVKNDNARFMAAAFSVLPPNPVLWDEFYKPGRTENRSIMRFVLQEPPLRWAWFLAISLLLLYMIVYVRRQQRAIPIMVPPRNASRELAHTIGRLYWHKGDHADLARKMIMHFKDEVRARTYLRTFAYDAATTEHLASKTGRAKDEIAQRLAAFQQRELQPYITESELLQLSSQLHEFRQLIP